MKRRTTKRRTTKRRTIKRRPIKRRTMKRRPRKIMVGGEETVVEREIRKTAEANKIEKETHEERRKRENLDIDRKQEGTEIIENLLNKIKNNSGNIKKLLVDEDYYNIYMINACCDKIVNKYGNDLYEQEGIKFINEFISNKYGNKFNDVKENDKIRNYPLVYLSYRDKKDDRERIILKDELPFIWPWDWDDYIMSYADFINSTEYKNALTAYNH